MKPNIIPLSAALSLILLLTGCKGFLEEYSQDTVVPTSAKDYSEVLYGDAYYKEVSLPYQYIELMTDDVEAKINTESTQGEDQRRTAYGYFTWQQDPELSPTNVLNPDGSWVSLYSQILTANIVIDALETMTGTPDEKAQLEGEAHAVRLNAYFLLANLYGEPYDPATADRAKGVPINDHHYAEDANFPRATVAENYAEMTEAVEKAMDAFSRTKSPRNIFRWNAAAVAVLASRVYLHMQDWDNVIKYADEALRLNPALLDLNTLPAPGSDEALPFIRKDNREIDYSYGFNKIPELSTAHPFYFSASEDLLSQYEEGDLRYYDNKGYFINANRTNVGSWWFPQWKYTIDIVKSDFSEDTRVYGFAIRSAEAYLNRAEAYAEKGEIDKALADLNTLRRARITPEHAQLAKPDSREEMIRMVRLERRRELCFELQRWFDLRRQGMPELHHTYITGRGEETGTEEYILQARSPRYVIPVPHNVLNSDAVLGGTDGQTN